MLVLVYTCQNVKLLEISCPGPNLFGKMGLFWARRPVSMNRKCHNHRPQTDPWHREEESQNNKSQMIASRQQAALSSSAR